MEGQEKNIFDILIRDTGAPDDLFKPLDVHFARNHTLTNLLALYPSVRTKRERENEGRRSTVKSTRKSKSL